jgi:hypothetical protein
MPVVPPVPDNPEEVPLVDDPAEEVPPVPADAPPAAPPPAPPPPPPPPPAAKATLLDTANRTASINVLIFIIVSLVCWTQDQARRWDGVPNGSINACVRKMRCDSV